MMRAVKVHGGRRRAEPQRHRIGGHAGARSGDATRRRFLRAVGASTAYAAVASVFPFGALEAMAQEKKPPEKRDLKIGFISITCASPLIMADPLGFYREQGLNVQLMKTAGWALIRDKMINKEHDASHLLSPMPLAMSMGLGSAQQPMRVATIQNVNGQAITLHTKHKDRRDPRQWKGFKFAVPFEYSMHNFLLRYYVAEHGLDPDTDIQIRVTPPPEMVANCAPATSTAFSGPTRSTSAPCTTRSASSTSCRRRSGTATPAARSACRRR